MSSAIYFIWQPPFSTLCSIMAITLGCRPGNRGSIPFAETMKLFIFHNKPTSPFFSILKKGFGFVLA